MFYITQFYILFYITQIRKTFLLFCFEQLYVQIELEINGNYLMMNQFDDQMKCLISFVISLVDISIWIHNINL